jgi:hypothetical protein
MVLLERCEVQDIAASFLYLILKSSSYYNIKTYARSASHLKFCASIEENLLGITGEHVTVNPLTS